jgi:hypothetical protein
MAGGGSLILLPDLVDSTRRRPFTTAHPAVTPFEVRTSRLR